MRHHLWTRRHFTAASAVAALGAPTLARAQQPRVRIVAKGLITPESPKPQADGSVILVEMTRGTLSRVAPDGTISVIADLGGSPNGCAMGPNNEVYVCNNGGLIFKPVGDVRVMVGAVPNATGSIQRVNAKTGAFTVLYSTYEGAPLKSCNDVVFDKRGGFWFTAPGQPNPAGGPNGAIFWATEDGKTLKRVAWNSSANGIAISPDGNTLLSCGGGRGCIQAFKITGQGQLAMGADGEPSRTELFNSGGAYGFDSLCVDSAGNAVVGTLQSGDVATLPREGCITVVAPDGKLKEQVPMPDRFVTNIGFGGPGLKTAYASLTTTGQLAAVDWPVAGLKLLY